jgi:signal transduction histidine kinase
VHLAFYRIAQEALNNVVKHAQASYVEVSLRCDPSPGEEEGELPGGPGRVVELRVSDDGEGFDPGAVPPDHLGLGIMNERAQAIGAQLAIETQIGHGTLIKAVWTDEQ